jgi:hypothetical protein
MVRVPFPVKSLGRNRDEPRRRRFLAVLVPIIEGVPLGGLLDGDGYSGGQANVRYWSRPSATVRGSWGW